jgi:hypothetical protein
MPANLLLLPLLGGYWFVHFCHFFRFRAQRQDGYRLLLESAFAGVLLTAAARLIVVLLSSLNELIPVREFWNEYIPLPFAGTATGAFLLGIVSPFVVNLILPEGKAKDLLLRRHGNALFRLLHESVKSKRAISISLDTRKWYAGYVTESPNLDPQEQYFSLIPILSGYRDINTLTVTDTVLYSEAYEHTDKNLFSITIPLAAVKSANFFDQNVYETFFDADGDAAEAEAKTMTAGGGI